MENLPAASVLQEWFAPVIELQASLSGKAQKIAASREGSREAAKRSAS
jgi:hypothetical protein